MAETDAPVIEETGEEDGQDEGVMSLTPEELAELDAMELLEQFISAGGSERASIRVKFRRILRPEDENVPGISAGFVGSFPNGRVRELKPDTLEEDAFGAFGGGIFDLDFFLNGKFQKGMSKRITVAGPARQRLPEPTAPTAQASPQQRAAGIQGLGDGDAAPTAQPSLGAVATATPMTAAEVARLVSDQLAAARQADRLAALERENQELKANPPARQAATKEASTAEMVELVFKKIGEVNRQLTAAPETPEATANRLRAEKAEAREKELAERLAAQEKKEDAARFDRLERLIRLKKKKKPQSPFAGALAPLLELTALDTTLAKLNKRVDDGETGGLLEGVLQIVKPELEKLGVDFMKGLRKNLEEQRKPRELPAGEGAPKIDHDAWIAWVQGVLQNPGLVEDRAYVRDGVSRFGPYVSRLIAVTDREQMIAFVREAINAETAELFTKADPAEVSKLIAVVGVLRGTVVACATPPAEASPQQRAAGIGDAHDAGADADDPDEDEEDDDEDEDEDDQDDDDETTTVDGKVAE